MTQATDESEVSQGLAGACRELGIAGVTSDPLLLERAFRHAWEHWPHARRFPTIRADFGRNSIRRIMRKSANRRGPVLAAWELGRWMEPYFMDGADLADVADLIPKFTDVPWSAWLDLARVFISEFGPADVVREGDADQT